MLSACLVFTSCCNTDDCNGMGDACTNNVCTCGSEPACSGSTPFCGSNGCGNCSDVQANTCASLTKYRPSCEPVSGTCARCVTDDDCPDWHPYCQNSGAVDAVCVPQ